MGLIDWLGSKGPAGQIARRVYFLFIETKKRCPEMSEEEIARTIFAGVCGSSVPSNEAEAIRVGEYLEDDSRITSIYDLCMAIIDIELNITEKDGKAFKSAKKIVVNELNSLGYGTTAGAEDEYQRKVIDDVRRGVDERNRRLAEWAESVPITDRQRNAMWELWVAGINKKPPKIDPLSNLSKEELEYVFKICRADFRPTEFGNADVSRLSSFLYFRDLCFTVEQATVLAGMMFNMVGRKDV